MGAELQAENYSTQKILPYQTQLHSHIPSCIHNYALTHFVITFGSQSCFGNFMTAGRAISSKPQHPSSVKLYTIIIAAARKLVLHHLHAPVTASGFLAAKAIWCRILDTPFIKEIQKKEYSSTIK